MYASLNASTKNIIPSYFYCSHLSTRPDTTGLILWYKNIGLYWLRRLLDRI